jgi:hypothetical protein
MQFIFVFPQNLKILTLLQVFLLVFQGVIFLASYLGHITYRLITSLSTNSALISRLATNTSSMFPLQYSFLRPINYHQHRTKAYISNKMSIASGFFEHC